MGHIFVWVLATAALTSSAASPYAHAAHEGPPTDLQCALNALAFNFSSPKLGSKSKTRNHNILSLYKALRLHECKVPFNPPAAVRTTYHDGERGDALLIYVSASAGNDKTNSGQ